MSTFYEEITLENPIDVALAKHGVIKESEFRRMTVNALVERPPCTLVSRRPAGRNRGLARRLPH
jgi:hypothetical protein